MNMQRLKHWGQVALITVVVIGVFAGGSVHAKVYEKSQDSRSSQNSAEGKSGRAGSKKGDTNFISAGATLVADQIVDFNKPWWKKGWDLTKDYTRLVGAYIGDKAKQVWDGGVTAAKWTGGIIVTGTKWTAKTIVTGVKWIGDQSYKAIKWVYHQAKIGFRSFTSTLTGTLSIVLPPVLRFADNVLTHTDPLWGFEKNFFSAVYHHFDPQDPESISKDGDVIEYDDASNSCIDKGSQFTNETKSSNGKKHIIYVNGIKTTYQAHCETLKNIHKITCCDVSGVYNATEGAMPDLWQSAWDRLEDLKQESKNKATVSLVKELDAQKDYSNIQLWCHSQGGIICSNAIKREVYGSGIRNLDSDFSKLSVTSFGAASVDWAKGPKYDHFVNVQDIVAEDLGLTDSAAPNDANGNVHYFSGADGQNINFNNPKKKWLRDLTFNNHLMDPTYIPAYKQFYPNPCN